MTQAAGNVALKLSDETKANEMLVFVQALLDSKTLVDPCTATLSSGGLVLEAGEFVIDALAYFSSVADRTHFKAVLDTKVNDAGYYTSVVNPTDYMKKHECSRPNGPCAAWEVMA